MVGAMRRALPRASAVHRLSLLGNVSGLAPLHTPSLPHTPLHTVILVSGEVIRTAKVTAADTHKPGSKDEATRAYKVTKVELVLMTTLGHQL